MERYEIKDVYPHFRHEMLYFCTVTRDVMPLDLLAFFDGFDIESKKETTEYLDYCLSAGTLEPIGTDATLQKILNEE